MKSDTSLVLSIKEVFLLSCSKLHVSVMEIPLSLLSVAGHVEVCENRSIQWFLLKPQSHSLTYLPGLMAQLPPSQGHT